MNEGKKGTPWIENKRQVCAYKPCSKPVNEGPAYLSFGKLVHIRCEEPFSLGQAMFGDVNAGISYLVDLKYDENYKKPGIPAL